MNSHHVHLATGLRYHVLEWDGPGELTFVLVHGFTDLAFAWRDVAERLAAHGHVIAPTCAATATASGSAPAATTTSWTTSPISTT